MTAISPDRNHGRYFPNDHPRLKYVRSRFEGLDLEREFDLVLMAESQNYFDAEEGFRQCRRYVRPGGHLLVSGIFRREGVPLREPFEYLTETAEDFTRKAAGFGLELKTSREITANVLPTLELCRDFWRRCAGPIGQLADLWRDRRPLVARAVGRALRPELQELKKLKERFDPEVFASNCRYVTLRFVREPRGNGTPLRAPRRWDGS